MKLSPVKKILIVVISLNVVMIAVCAFFFFEIRGINFRISNLNREIEMAKRKDTVTNSMQETVEGARADIEKLNSYFISADGVGGFIETIEAMSKKMGLSPATNLIKEEDMEGKGLKEGILMVNFETSGSWSDTLNFLSVLESLPYKIDMEKVALTGDSAGFEDASSKSATDKKIPVKGWKADFQFSVFKLK